ncbi:MAG: sigma-54-dependent Fis family transcriptional regulator [Candidatus Liberibacter europaeus]|uniref:Sigma-54-dependent Fis family transcriptional regulator n=1 Tax=Candidatus Liberibacter europaeus TaxID=744859 RepID=A0A2T4VX46_9HYPH|nr:sigma-54-dependent Fis family transcriptional regulator [Candidatus Liberibacter europaeus]PTL86356.1 MAG: sigma-54-dependent Fis family transcriptional regulator [Candidatus Liberibacter europaeus]
MTSDILIVDAKQGVGNIISSMLEDRGYSTRVAKNMYSALLEMKNSIPQLVFLDFCMTEYSGNCLSLFDKITELFPDIPFVITVDHEHFDMAIASIKRKTCDFIVKPFNKDQILLTVNKAISNARINEICDAQKEIEDEGLIGISGTISRLRQSVDRIAPTNSRVMIFGLSGSGKHFLARLIHNKSARSKGSFVFFDSASIPSEFMDIALFGIENSLGKPEKIGYLERACHGTIYINKITDIPCTVQDKLLRALVHRKFKRVNGVNPIALDARIISSIEENYYDCIVKRLLIEDLYYRLAVVSIRVPGLVERKEDIPFLTESLINQISKKLAICPRHISSDAMVILQGYDWPGNILELKKYLEKILFLMRKEDPKLEITVDMLPSNLGRSLPTSSVEYNNQVMNLPLREAREAFEKNYLMAQINRFGGNVSRTAGFVGMERSALHRKLKSLGL